MKRQLLTDARYHTIGYIDTAADGKQTARDARLHVVGYGNLLASLVASS